MAALLDLLLPPRCPGCGREGEILCGACARPLLRRLGEPASLPVGVPSLVPPGLAGLEFCAIYSGPVRAALQALKYDGEQRLVEPLAAAVTARIRHARIPGELIAHVPVHRERARERGFDQAALLAAAVAVRLRVPSLPLLARSAATVAQHALGRDARASNVGSAFRVAPRYRALLVDRRVILIDDIVTTGATMGGCASALLEAGARSVWGVAVARDR
jgi:ComF family protein